MSGLHVIVKGSGADRRRLRGVFTDEQFFALPLVRSFGAFPSGYAALHFDPNPRTVGYGMVMAIKESPVSAEIELGCLERYARRAKYVVACGDAAPWYFSSVKAANAKAEQIVSAWRGTVGGRGGYSNTAVKVVSYRDVPNQPGAVISLWSLKRCRRHAKALSIRRLDARGALEYADKFNRREVD